MKKPVVLKKEQIVIKEIAAQKVMYVLSKYPDKEFSLSDLAKEAGIAKGNIGQFIRALESEQIIKIERLSKIWRIRANRENPAFLRAKLLLNLAHIYTTDLIEVLNQHYRNPKAIVLFGSYRKGEDISGSDIDIGIENDDVKEYATVRLDELSKLEKQLDRKIQIHLFNRKTTDINLFNNIANGIVLSGFLQVRP